MDKLEEKRLKHLSAAEKIAVRQAIREYAAKERDRRAARKLADDARKADAHRKIVLGGLLIAAGVDHWNEAEIVGALLAANHRLAQDGGDGIRAKFRDVGIDRLAEREAAKAKK